MAHVAYLGIGSNLGDREGTIQAAIGMLQSHPGISGIRVSTLHETRPVGGPAGQGPYLNAAAEILSNLEAEPLLDVLVEVEARLGRQRRERWGPRTIDLDLLLFDQQEIDSPRLQVPHPRMTERRFVLAPLAEIAPETVHPGTGLTVSQLLQRLDALEAQQSGRPHA